MYKQQNIRYKQTKKMSKKRVNRDKSCVCDKIAYFQTEYFKEFWGALL